MYGFILDFRFFQSGPDALFSGMEALAQLLNLLVPVLLPVIRPWTLDGESWAVRH